MDGQLMSNQDQASLVQAELQAIEASMANVLAVLVRNPQPFDDKQCNRRLKRLKRRWARMLESVEDWHGDIEECVSTGDPTVQFGGK